MSFHLTSQNIRIEFADNSTWLVADVRDANGHYHHNRVRLDKHIGNSDGEPDAKYQNDKSILTLPGWFLWGGENFTLSARDIRLEHGPRGPKLTAELPKIDGGFRERQGIDLADKIENRNGHLVYLVGLPEGVKWKWRLTCVIVGIIDMIDEMMESVVCIAC